MKRSNQTAVTCFYCPETFRRAQGRAAHIRYQHPGKPYRPSVKDLQEAEKARTPTVNLAPPPAPPPQAVPDAAAPLDTMSPREHVVAGIASIKRRQEDADRQLPELEKQLESLRALRAKMDSERKALETALAIIDEVSVPAAHAS